MLSWTGKQKSASLGLIVLFTYNFFAAAKDVIIGNQASKYNAYVMAACVFLIAMVFFQVILQARPENKLVASKKAIYDIVSLNISTAGSWIALYYALSIVEPALVSALIAGLNPICTLALNKFFRPNSKVLTAEVLGSTLILILALYLFWVVLSGNSGVDDTGHDSNMIGLIMGCVSAVCFSATTVWSKKLHDQGYGSIYVMAHRFYALIAVSTLAAGGISIVMHFLIGNLFMMVIISFFGVIVSLYLLQEGTRLCEPMTVEMVLVVAPVITLAFQFLDSRIALSLHSVIANFMLVAVAALVLRSQISHEEEL